MDSDDDGGNGERVKIAALVCLTIIIVASITGITLTALFTDRDLFRAETYSFGGVLMIGLLGGVTFLGLRRRRRWRLEREDVNGG
jgi:hypothetical protein